jgi:hypothetical protein
MKSHEQKINAREIDGAPPAGRLSQPTPNASGVRGLQGGDLKSEVSDDPTLNQNAHWVQRASWKSLVGADGRASFSLISSVTGDRREPEKGSQKQKAEEKKKKRPDGSSFMRSATAEEDWRASRSELRMDSKAKHKAAVRTIKKLWGPGRSGSQK